MEVRRQTIWAQFRRQTVSLLAGSLLLLGGNAEAARICVPSSFDGSCSSSQATISAAITAATSGVDDIYVQAGTYNENINYGGKNITILSASGAASTFIKGTTGYNNNPVVQFVSGETASAVLDGFTLDNNTANASNTRGITITNSSPTIQNCIIENNEAYYATPGYGAGIKTTGTGGATIINTIIRNNTTGTSGEKGGGIYHSGSGLLSMTGGSVESNFAYKGGGGIVGTSGNITLDGVTVKLNTSGTGLVVGGGGIHYTGGGTLTIQNSSSIESNTANKGGGGGIWLSASTLNISDSTIKSNLNSGSYGGGGIHVDGASTATISNSYFLGNRANGTNNNSDAGGIKIGTGATATITNTVVAGNTADNAYWAEGGGIYNGGTLNLYFSTVADNYSDNQGGGVHGGGTENIYNSIIWGNSVATGTVELSGTAENLYLTETTTDPTFTTRAAASKSTPTTTGVYTLQSGSNSIDTGDSTNAPSTDITGTSRPQGGGYDKGAYELVSATPPTNTFTSATYDSSTNTLVFTGTNFDTIDAVSTDIKTYMDWTKFSWDVNGDNGTTTDISVAVTDVTSLTITNATTLTLVFTSAKATAIEATTDAGIPGGVDTIDITAGFSRTSGGTPATTDGLADGTFTIDSNEFNVTKIADTAGNCTLSDCSLREAISAANADASATPASPHIINIPADASPYTITLTGLDSTNAAGDFDVKEDIKFVGAGAASTTISGQAGGGDWVFQLFTGYTITFEGVTITNNGNDSGQTTGGCVYSDSNLTVKDSTFNTCKAGRGGAILVSSGYSLTIDNSTFTSNTTTDKGGAVLAYGITIQNGATFQNNYATNLGGAIHNGTQDITINGTTLFDNNDTSQGSADRGGAIYTTGNIILNDTSGATTFQNNDAYCGGAINVDSNTKLLTAYGTIFTSNTTNNHGGALCVYGANLTDVTFTNNSTTNYGGAIYSLTNDLTINGTNSFTNNDTAKLASDNGGAIYATGNVSINETSGSSTFENNDAYCGGAININSSTKRLTAKNLTFNTNTAQNIGGALCIQGGTLTDVSFTSNSSVNQGGAIYNINAALTINGTSNTFTSNSSTSDVGGAISSPSGAVDVANTTFNLNTAAGNGGAISANNGSSCCTVTATDSSFTSNQSTGGNGGAINARSGITLTDTTIHGNTASGSGGGAFTAAGAATLTRVTFSSNTATSGDGGGIWTSSGVNAYNSTFSENTANAAGKLGGGVYTNSTGACSYINTTFYNNSANSNGSSLRAGAACTIKNTLMTSNGTAKNCRLNTHTVTTSKEYHSTQAASCNFGALDAGLNVDTLKDNGGKTKTHALISGSTAIDNGDLTTCTNAPISNLDQRGVTRDTGDSKCDIGAYEGSVAAAGPTNTFTSGTYDSATNTLVLTGTNFDTIDAVSTDVKTYMDWTKFSWDINGDNGTTTDISVTVTDVTSLTITNATTLTLVFTTTKANSIEATAGVGIDGNADTLDITAGFSKDSSANPATTDGLADGTFTIDNNEFNVTKNADTADGNCTLADCSLREAITGANNVAGANTINVPDNTYTLTGASGEDSNANGDYDISGDVTIAGTSLANTTVDANSVDRVFDIKAGASVTLSNMTVKRGLIAANGGCVLTNNTLITLNTVKFDTCKGTTGGAVYAANGFHITASQFNANWATATGGAIYNTAAAGDFYGANSFTGNHADGSGGDAGGALRSNAQIITIHDSGSLFDGNYGTGSGGAIWVSAAFNVSAATTIQNNYSTTTNGGGAIISKGGTITETTFKNNYSSDYGGAVFFVTNSGAISNSTFEGNYVSGGAAGYGGAFYANVGGTTFTNVTFSGNTGKNGGAIYNAGVCTIKNSTFYNNDASTGTGDHVGCVNGTVTNSVFYSATAPSSSLCYGVPNGTNNYKYNHAGSGCGASSTNADPLLSPLADNGGNTKTHAPYVGSPLLDAGDLTTCTNAPVSNLDQIGTTRDTGDSKCDIGAYEGSIALPGVAISGTVYTDEGTITIADGATVRLIINGVSAGTDTTTSGAYSITASPSAGDAMIVYIDGHASDGTTVTVSDGNALAGLNIYADHLITRHDNAGSLTNANMTTALGAYSDTEILYTTDGSDNLTVGGANTELYVWTGDTYTPGATIDTVHMDIVGTLDAAANAIYVSGNWDVDAAGVFTSTGTVTLDATSGTNTITPGGTDADHDFENIIFNDAAGSATFQLTGAIDVDGNFTVTDGIVDTTGSNYAITVGGDFSQAAAGQVEANSSTITVAGNFSVDGTTDSTDYNNASLIFNGSGSNINYANLSSWWSNGFSNLTVGQSGVTDTLNNWLTVKTMLTIGTGELTGASTLALTAAGTSTTFDAASNLSVDTLMFIKFGGSQNIVSLTNGYDSDISIAGGSALTVTQTGAVTINSGSNLIITGDGNASRELTYDTGGFDLSVGGNITVGNDTDTAQKTFDGSNSIITVGGNFSLKDGGTPAAVFTSTGSTVILNGVNQSLDGNISFNNFSKTESTNDATDSILTFTAGDTFTVAGTLTLDGLDADDRINLVSATPSSTFAITVTGAKGTLDYLDVTDSDASGSTVATPLNPANSINGGNTTDWFVVTVAISGTVYTDEGTTTIADGATVRLIINGASAGTDTTTSGAYSITASPSAGDAMIVYIDGHASDGTTVTVSDGNALASLDIYADHLITRHDNAGSLTNANMTTALGAYSDAEILYTTDGSNNLTVSGIATELYVATGHVFAPGANVSTKHVKINGTLTAGGNTLTVSGDWDMTNGTFNYDTSTVDFTGTGSISNDNADWWTKSFYNLNAAAAGQTTTVLVTRGIVVQNVMTLDTGTVDGGKIILSKASGTPLVTAGATLSNLEFRYTGSTGPVTVASTTYPDLWIAGGSAGSAQFNLAGDINCDLLSVRGNSASKLAILDTTTNNYNITCTTLQVGIDTLTDYYGTLKLNNSTVDINGNVVIYSSDAGGTNTLDGDTSSINVSGTWTNSDVFNSDTSTVTFDGTSGTIAITPGGTDVDHDFYNIVFNDAAGTATYQLAGAIDADGDFTVTDGIVDTTGSNYAITVGGNFSQAAAGQVEANGSTITVAGNFTADGTTDETDYNGASLVMTGDTTQLTYNNLASFWANGFNNLTVGASNASIQLNDHLAIGSMLTVGSGALTGSSSMVTLKGTPTPLSVDANANISVNHLVFLGWGQPQNLPNLPNGYDCNIVASGDGLVLSQTGNVTINSPKSLWIKGDNVATRVVTYNTAGFDLNVGKDIIVGAGSDTGAKTLNMTNSSVGVAGDFTINSGVNALTSTGSTVTLNGTATQGITLNGKSFNNLIVTNASDVVTFSDDLSTTNLTAVTPSTQLTFTGSTTNTISGTLDLNGQAAGTKVVLRSTDTNQYILDVTGGEQNVSYVDVQYSAASSFDIRATNSTNSGNNDDAAASPHWVFSSTVAISGVVYTDEGTTTIADGATVRLVRNGSSVGTTAVSGGAGAYSINVDVSAGDAFLVYLDDHSTNGTTVSVSDGAALANFDIYGDHLLTRHDNGGNLTNALMDTAVGSYSDTGSDTDDILYAIAGGNLSTSGAATEILIPTGHTFVPGGDVSTVHVKINGTLTAGSNTLTVSGDWDMTNGTFNYDTSTVDFTGTGEIKFDNASWWTKPFYNVSAAASGKTTTIFATSGIQVNNVFTVGSGTLTGGTVSLKGTGTPFVTGGATLSNSQFIYNGDTGPTNVASASYPNIDFKGNSATNTFNLAGNVSCNNMVIRGNGTNDTAVLDTTTNNYSINCTTIQVGHTATTSYGTLKLNGSTVTTSSWLTIKPSDGSGTNSIDADTSTINVAGNWTNGDTFTADTSSVVLNGTGQSVNGSTTFYDLTKSVAAADTLAFEAGKTTTIATSGTVTLNGASGQLLILASSTGTSAWNFNIANGASKSISYVDVSWSDASGSDASHKPINPANSNDGGNNVSWFGSADIVVTKTSTVISDGVSASNPKRIPGAIIEYTIKVENVGGDSPDTNSVLVTTSIDTNDEEFYYNGGTGDITFTDGATSSALTMGTVVYSNDSGSTYVYSPSGSYDSAVTNVQIPMSGTFAFGGAPSPSFTLKYRVRVK